MMGEGLTDPTMMDNYYPKAFYHYLGGLTTPTCDMVVNWFSATDPIKIS